jgi:hypothetical protein
MAVKDLCTLARAKQAIQSITDSSQDALLGVLITAASDAIEKYCKRNFVSKVFDELYNGSGDRRLLLRQYPIQSVRWVRYRPVTVLKIVNNNTNLNQRATVRVTSTGLNLERVATGVVTNDTSVTWAGNVTLNAVVTAINALGSGWSAQIVGDAGQGSGTGDYGLWPSADLYVPPAYGDGVESQGALTARGQFAELKMHTYELAGYQYDPRGWLLRAIPYTDPELLHPEDLVWPVGINNFRVYYTAGYTTIPEAIQEACAEWVSDLYYRTQRDPALRSQAVAGAVSQAWGGPSITGNNPPQNILPLLKPYRRHTIATGQG